MGEGERQRNTMTAAAVVVAEAVSGETIIEGFCPSVGVEEGQTVSQPSGAATAF